MKNGRYIKLGDDNPDIYMIHYTIYVNDGNLPSVKKYDSDYSLK